MISFEHFLDTLLSTIRDVIPIAAIIFGFQLAVLRRPVNNLKKSVARFCVCHCWVIVVFTRFGDGIVSVGRNNGGAVDRS